MSDQYETHVSWIPHRDQLERLLLREMRRYSNQGQIPDTRSLARWVEAAGFVFDLKRVGQALRALQVRYPGSIARRRRRSVGGTPAWVVFWEYVPR